MDLTTDEIEGSQFEAVRCAGSGATSNKPEGLRYNISVIREIASQYCSLTVRDQKSRVYFVLYFTKLLKSANNQLTRFLEKLEQGQCMEVFCISSNQYRNDKFWMWCDNICNDMKGEMIYDNLKLNIDTLKTLLADAEHTIRHCKPELFEKFFFNEKQNYGNDGIRKRFENWLYDNLPTNMEKLRELQARVVADALKKGIMDSAPKPSYHMIKAVKVDYLKNMLPYDFEMTSDFIEACARWKDFIHWEGTILKVNYRKYGKYIQGHYYDLNNKKLLAIFELDMMLNLIHKEMQKLMPTEPLVEKVENEEVLQEKQLMGEKLELQLKPLFYNNEDNVKLFLKEIDGMPPNDITDLVNQWVRDKRISDYGNSRKGVLWGILNKAGLYNRSRQNWNGRVD